MHSLIPGFTMSPIMDNTQLFLDPAFWLDPCTVQNGIVRYPTGFETYTGTEELERRRRKTRMRASRACIACRSRHTKCDGVEPVCTRCQVEEKSCVYTKSRRGGSGRVGGVKKIYEKGSVRSRTSTGSQSDEMNCNATSVSTTTSPHSESLATFRHDSGSPGETHSSISDSVDDESHLSRYFEFFHNAHPIVLPRKKFLLLLKNRPSSLDYLLPVLNYIGALYTPGIQTDTPRQIAHEKLNEDSLPKNAFSVQALILFSLAIHCLDEYEAAEEYLNKAIDIALLIKMNTQEFAWKNAEGDAILAESWRRTWWILYCIDAVFAAISHYPSHRLQENIGDVMLPCEDHDYYSGKIPELYSLSDYDNREFSEEETVFSSFTYLIDACRTASSMIALDSEDKAPGERVLEALDAKFVNWFLYLPKCKTDVVLQDGKVDETMFLAHIVINCEKLTLHRPHSLIPYSSLETKSKCTPPTHLRTRSVQRSILLHTSKSLEAIENSIKLFAITDKHLLHSPIVTCALALAVMAQVGACNLVVRGGGQFGKKGSYETGRERIRLGLGALRSQKGVWGMARRSVREVSGVARELLGVKSGSNGSSGFTGSTGQESGDEGRRVRDIHSAGEEALMNDVVRGDHEGEESFLDLLGAHGDDQEMGFMRFQDFESIGLEVSV
ncbi:hypothetical protein HYFRA_00003059 [Hymenoscyphus fraxineus]|uniref:Zn(2)-C6 fungal-type domain-containing protein n=1 Tax=Hymenoscyphus fraxineus TaxID=746836 RepID=A0A9N9PQU9_9HELO|nr:hypothetical protein HYFRA_00003059 [Hymenoscyphus fraxineus]